MSNIYLTINSLFQKLNVAATKCKMFSLDIIDDYIEANFVNSRTKRFQYKIIA